MKILVLIHEYPPIGGGGGKVAQDIAHGLVRLGHEVTALVPRMNGMVGCIFFVSVPCGERLLLVICWR